MLHMDFSQPIVIETEELDWIQSPSSGVLRKSLEKAAAESGWTTSIVRYEPGSSFCEHVHPMGEEIFVLEGVFSDETGDYPAGTYLRNPPGSRHAPFSVGGCTLFVKLDHFDHRDRQQVRINTKTEPWLPGYPMLTVMPLHSFETQHTALVKWSENAIFQPHRHYGGEEILVLSGTFYDEHGCYPTMTWMRSPHLSQHHPFVKEETVILVKTGHLPISSHL